jgi:hypothetical protein
LRRERFCTAGFGLNQTANIEIAAIEFVTDGRDIGLKRFGHGRDPRESLGLDVGDFHIGANF